MMDVTTQLPIGNIRFRFNWKHAATILLTLYALLFPLYRHIMDIDAVGYITVARHYAAGEWYAALNGYWSPLNSWLMVPLIKAGLNPIFCFKTANVFFGIAALYQTQKILNYFSFSQKQITGVLVTTTIMMLYYASIQLAADMLFVTIFLWYVNVALKGDLYKNYKRNILLGLVAAVAFFAKTYGGVFFIIHFSFLHLVWYPFVQKKGWHLNIYVVGILAWLPLIIGWMLLLHHKYHIVTFGYSGQLNWSWVLKTPQPDYSGYFYEPPYPGAVSRWVDPWYSQVKTYSPFQSKELMWKGLRLIGYNLKKSFWATMWISFLAPVLLVWLLIKIKINTIVSSIALIIVLFPMVYLLIFMEERYLWPVSVLLLIAASYLLQHAPFGKKWLWLLLLVSFITGPVIKLVLAVNKDIETTKLIAIINQYNLHGRFTAADSGEWMHKAAFITGNQYLPITRTPKSWQEVETECTANNISAICIEQFSQEDAVAFVGSEFYKRHQTEAIKVPDRYLWVIRL